MPRLTSSRKRAFPCRLCAPASACRYEPPRHAGSGASPAPCCHRRLHRQVTRLIPGSLYRGDDRGSALPLQSLFAPIIRGAGRLGGIMNFHLSTPRRETFLVSAVIAALVVIGMIVPLPFFTGYGLGL